MTTLNLIVIITLIVILIVGIVIKIYTKRKLSEMDGVDAVFIVKEEDKHTTEELSGGQK